MLGTSRNPSPSQPCSQGPLLVGPCERGCSLLSVFTALAGRLGRECAPFLASSDLFSSKRGMTNGCTQLMVWSYPDQVWTICKLCRSACGAAEIQLCGRQTSRHSWFLVRFSLKYFCSGKQARITVVSCEIIVYFLGLNISVNNRVYSHFSPWLDLSNSVRSKMFYTAPQYRSHSCTLLHRNFTSLNTGVTSLHARNKWNIAVNFLFCVVADVLMLDWFWRRPGS